MGSHRIMEGEHEFFLLCGQPMTSPIRGDLHLMAGRLILRFNFTKLFFVTNSFFNDSRVWLGSGDNGKWTIAHLTPILKMKPYFWLCLAHEIFFILMTSHFTAAQWIRVSSYDGRCGLYHIYYIPPSRPRTASSLFVLSLKRNFIKFIYIL